MRAASAASRRRRWGVAAVSTFIVSYVGAELLQHLRVVSGDVTVRGLRARLAWAGRLEVPCSGFTLWVYFSLAIYSGERRMLQLLLTHTLITFRCYHPALLHCNRLLRGVQVSAR